jgi:hypothetical protein
MNHSNRDRTPDGAEHVVKRLEEGRTTASPLELDRLKLQAMQQAERARPSLYAQKKGTFMKSRLALTLVLVAGFMFSTTGATLAISGSSGSGSAANSQYVSPHNEEGKCGSGGGASGEGGTGGEGAGGQEGAGGEKCGSHGVKGVGTKGESNNTLSGPSNGAGPVATEQVAVATEESGSTLPFTGFLAIPLLVLGLGLIVVGAVIKVKSRNSPPVA